ncbi:MFS transporter [Synechococcus sp. CBW1002]|uniref:MFS transporter n=1 Tax=unclassified Synechococcus TaxID=2626047 RepID=UPI0018CCDE87|nr:MULTISPECIES: MFS transporter [unclassified Synechococcus]QPN61440.1 MFS transporter [Synechococcus sp. CBW1002]QPN68439.1 MFS transporter [Synechococcus sp. CBW1006]
MLETLHRHQRTTFLIASGVSTAGSFAGITAKGWILMHGTGNPMVLALHFAVLALPSLLVSGPAGVLTDRLGCETVLIRAQWGLFLAGTLGALAIPLQTGTMQVVLLMLSTMLAGIASSFELTARNKYCALVVDHPGQLARYITSFSVVFNVGKLVGPPVGGWLVAATGPLAALTIDAATYLLPIATVVWLLRPNRAMEQRSRPGQKASLISAWKDCGRPLRHVLGFTALACLAGFFHPGLAPLMAAEILGPSPQALGLFTSVLAAGSICGGVVLQRNSSWLSQRPALLMGACVLATGAAQVGMGVSTSTGFALAMAWVIGAGTASLLAGVNLISQVGSPMVLRGRMAGLGQIAFLGGGGLSGLIAAGLSMTIGLAATFAWLGGIGVLLGLWELTQRAGLRIPPPVD